MDWGGGLLLISGPEPPEFREILRVSVDETVFLKQSRMVTERVTLDPMVAEPGDP